MHNRLPNQSELRLTHHWLVPHVTGGVQVGAILLLSFEDF